MPPVPWSSKIGGAEETVNHPRGQVSDGAVGGARQQEAVEEEEIHAEFRARAAGSLAGEALDAQAAVDVVK